MNLTEDDCRARFAAEARAQLATADAEGRPHIVPVTYAVDGDRVYIAVDSKPKSSLNLKRLRNILENEAVALLVDVYDDDWSKLWWVRADGTARILTEEADRSGPLGLLQGRYRQYVEDVPQGAVIMATITRWSGWQFAAAPDGSA